MNYPTSPDARSYICPGCSTAQQGPPQGGSVSCPQCRAPFVLPGRPAFNPSAAAPPMPPDDPNRLQQLRVQDGRPRFAAPSLAAVLGGQGIQPGREGEAWSIWQSLRGRSQQGDVAASEDLATLTMMLAQHPSLNSQSATIVALRESAYDACVLPRHKLEQLGGLTRRFANDGNRAAAAKYLSWMMPGAPELEADSEYRVSYAVVATMDRDPGRVLALLGPRKDAIPIADSMDMLATAFRANAFEMMGDLAQAQAVLTEFPNPQILTQIQQAWPRMGLCPRAGASYSSVAMQASAKTAAASASGVGVLLGGILGFIGLMMALAGGLPTLLADPSEPTGYILGGIGVVMLCVGVAIFFSARAKGKRAAWLRVNGLQLPARIVNAQMTGTRINDVPIYKFILQVQGPQGPYASSFNKLAPEHLVAMMVGQQVSVRANPQNLTEVVLEE